jgi:sporulation protein YlmC with PRC-barrel domain
MNRKLRILAGASAASLLAFSALADETVTAHRSTSPAGSERLNSAARATDIIGMAVQNRQNENLGRVEELVVDVESGRIVAVVLSTGGFFGRTNALIALPPGALHYAAADKTIQLDAGPGQTVAGPGFDSSRWDQDTQLNRATEADGYYGEQPYFVADNDGCRNARLEGTFAASLPHRMDGSINTDAARTLDKARQMETARNLESTNNWISTLNPDGTWTREYYSTERRANNSWSRLGYVQKAGRLIGTPVNNLQDEKLGQVENLMVDLSSSRIVAVIVSTGGFIGMDGELSAVPPTALHFNPGHDLLRLDTSRETLGNSPHFQAGPWPDFTQAGYAAGIYRAYNVEPWFNPEALTDADNTRPNIRDRDGTLATLDQGSLQTDADTEAQIRREIIADNRISANARNLKITAITGRVILCGPVGSAAEKRLIGEIANRIVQAGNVDNQLEVQIALTRNN